MTTGINSYSNNWVGGGAGVVHLGVSVSRQCGKANQPNTQHKNNAQPAVRANSHAGQETKHWSAPQKSSDLIDGLELLRFTLGGWVDPFISVRAISEFLDESDTMLVRYGNPLDITETVGGDRSLQKNENVDWSTRVGGAVHQLVDRHHLDTATGIRATDVTNDAGVEFDTDLKANNKAKWVTLLSSLRVYEALVSSKANAAKGTPQENDWRYPHVKWENNLTLNFAKYLMLNVSAYLYYDKNMSRDVRLKEALTAGLTYIYSKK